MRPSRIVLAASLAMGAAWVPVVANTGCTAAQGQPIVASLPPLGACIIQAAGADFVEALSDPISLLPAIAAACIQYGAVTAEAIVAAIESWFAAAPVVDAAAPSLQAARLKRVHEVFKASIAAKAGAKK